MQLLGMQHQTQEETKDKNSSVPVVSHSQKLSLE